jgi:dTDP-4-amino-4,6-dideoxygalactose transaminase
MSSMPSQGRVPAILGGVPAFANRFRFMVPSLPPAEQVWAIYHGAYQDGQITNSNLVARLESQVAERLQVKHCVAVSSCTSGLMLLLRALDRKGEVILPSFTFFATAHALVWNGLRPILADCDPCTWTLDPEDVERRLTPETTAIIGVHLYGTPCDVEALQEVAARNRLPLIFDSAHAFGSTHRGRPVGGFGDAEVFSMSPTKTLVAGEGGLVTTNDATLARRLRAARNYGDSGTYDCELAGLNARMSEFQAAMALAGFDMVDGKVRRHNEIARQYTYLLEPSGFRFPKVRPGDVSTYKDYCVHIDPEVMSVSRDELAAALLEENIETKKYFSPALHQQKLYRDSTRGQAPLPVTTRMADGVLSLPIYNSLSDQQVAGIAGALRSLVEAARSSEKPEFNKL